MKILLLIIEHYCFKQYFYIIISIQFQDFFYIYK